MHTSILKFPSYHIQFQNNFNIWILYIKRARNFFKKRIVDIIKLYSKYSLYFFQIFLSFIYKFRMNLARNIIAAIRFKSSYTQFANWNREKQTSNEGGPFLKQYSENPKLVVHSCGTHRTDNKIGLERAKFWEARTNFRITFPVSRNEPNRPYLKYASMEGKKSSKL